MHNPIVPSVEIELGGATRRLHYSHRDFATAEFLLKRQGWDISLVGPPAVGFWDGLVSEAHIPEDVRQNLAELRHEDVPAIVPHLDPFKVGVLLYVGLVRESPKLTLGEAQDLITFENMAEVSGAIFEAAIAPIAAANRKRDTAHTEAAAGDPLPQSSTGSGPGAPESSGSGSPMMPSGN